MESRALMMARHDMEKAQSTLGYANLAYRSAFTAVAVALVSFFGSITLNSINLIGDGTAWAWGGFGTFIFGFIAVGLFIYIDDGDVSITDARIMFEQAQRLYVEQLDREVNA